MSEIFKSDRYFTFFDVVISHGQLLIRSQKSDDIPTNIDIVFFDTTYIQSFYSFKGIRITRVEKNTDHISYNTVEEYLGFDNKNLFEIVSNNNEKYYIAASFLRVFENQLEFSESSLQAANKGVEIATSLAL